MKEYIERESLLADIEACVRITSRPDHPSAELRGANKVISRIKAIPAADVVPVRHGKWINPHWQGSTHCMDCSQCKYEAQHRVYHGTEKYYHYCPNCGARMDGDEDV